MEDINSAKKNILIVRCGEVALKGMNKPYFERMLAERIKKQVKRLDFENVDVTRHEGLIYVRSGAQIEQNALIKSISQVFGVASVSPAFEAETDDELNSIGDKAIEVVKRLIAENDIKTFKVEAKRADKNFPIKSPDIARKIGAKILIACKVLKVDVHNPDVRVYVDIRHGNSYVYTEKINAFGGLPLGTNGKGLVLLSGGIDSPVAAWMMAKRGMMIEAVHFHSYPYTSPRAQKKVEELAEILSTYCGGFKIHMVNLLPIQEEIVKNCPEAETTIHVRRFMMRIAEVIAKKTKSMMLITGENLGQVASQTAEALVVTDNCVNMPVMRPLIAMDKVDIMEMAKDIGTFEKSIEPYEDCCTVFLPKHPTTKPKLEAIESSESALDVDSLIEEAVSKSEIVYIKS